MLWKLWVWVPLVTSSLFCLSFALTEVTPLSKDDLAFEGHVADLQLTSEEGELLSILGSLVGLSLGDITSALSLAKIGIGVVDLLENIFVKVFNGTDINFSSITKPGMDKQLLAMYEIITLRLEQIQKATHGTASGLRALTRGLPSLVRWEIALDTIEDYTKPINNLYYRFAYYQKLKNDVEDHTLIDFAENVVSHSTLSVQSLLANIHSMAAPSDPPILRGARQYDRDEYSLIDKTVTKKMSLKYKKLMSRHPNYKKMKLQEMTIRPSIFRILEDSIKDYDVCHMKQTSQQLIFGLYTLLAITLARGFAMVSFSYNILKFHNEGNFTVEQKLAEELYTHYSAGLYRNAFDTLQRSSKIFRTCDPMEHVENKTFVMVTELLQGYIENEVDLNSRGTCGSKCSSYEHAEVKGCYMPDKQYCGKHRRCKGKVHDCRYFDADATVCISSVPYRRYDWIKYENKRIIGKEKSCDNLMKIDSWWRFFYHCSYCVCLCDDPKSLTSDRFVSLRPVVSDIAQGMIVTGIRFTKHNRVIHMQVQQGKSIPQGQVNPETLRWVDVDPISVGTSKFVENEDYVTLKYEERSIDLDHLKAPKGHVVTGVKFRKLGSHVNLEMWVTPINFTSGELSPGLSFWISNDNTPVMASNPRRRVSLIDPEDPRNNPFESDVDSHSDMFIDLEASSMNADAAQLTVPFFDAQEVAPVPPSWLEGLQLYHRGRSGYGGFIGFKVFNYDLIRHFPETSEL